jgi:serine-type D-Ala-D-Ala carboxypeptidase/endopeptidase
VAAEVTDVYRMPRDANPSRRQLVTLFIIVAGAVCVALAGTRDAEIAAAIKSRVEAKKAVGMVVTTIEPDGSSSLGAFGNAGPGARPLDADSVFEIGSITKVFTTILLADMADRGEVKLDDPVALYVPADVRIPERSGRKITLLDLSTQSSGLPRMPDNFRPSNLLNPYADYTVAQMFDFLGRYQLPRDVGAEFEYSNLGVGLLGHVLARRAGKSYEALVRERILDPLHMDHTGITPWMVEHLAKGHTAVGAVASNWDIPTFAGAGALRSTMTDMLKFARANLEPGGGRLQRVMQQTHMVRRSINRDEDSIGMNWVITRKNGKEVIWHNGGTGGYRTWLGFDKARRIAAVVLTNSVMSNDDLGFELVAGPAK